LYPNVNNVRVICGVQQLSAIRPVLMQLKFRSSNHLSALVRIMRCISKLTHIHKYTQ